MTSSHSLYLGTFAITVVVGVLISGGYPGIVWSPNGAGVSPNVAASLTVGPSVGRHLTSPFYSVVFEDSQSAPKSQAAFGHFFNSTPITVIRIGGASDSYDYTTQTNYVPPASGTHYVRQVGALVNFTWFKAWCYSKTPHCEWLGYLPGEENNTTAAVHTAKYFHNVLDFAPTYWQFGNEPGAWTHFGKNLTTWSTTDLSPTTGPGYATMVHDYIAAISKLFPNDRYIGIEDACACNVPLVSDLAQVDGSELAGVAYHNYPWTNGSDVNLAPFMASLESTASVPNSSAKMRTLVGLGCSTCASLPIEIGEYQAGGPAPTHSPFALTYAGAPFLAASIIQAIEANVSMFTVYDSGWLINDTSGQLQPQGLLYERILDNMTAGRDYPVAVNAKGIGGVFAMLVRNGTEQSLLLVNTNSTRGLQLTISTTVFPVGATGSLWYWGPHAADPRDTLSFTLPTTYSVPPQGILLLDNY